MPKPRGFKDPGLDTRGVNIDLLPFLGKLVRLVRARYKRLASRRRPDLTQESKMGIKVLSSQPLKNTTIKPARPPKLPKTGKKGK